MSTNTRRPHNLSAPFAGYVKLEWVRTHHDAYDYMRTAEDVYYVVGLCKGVPQAEVPRPRELVARVHKLVAQNVPVRGEDLLWVERLLSRPPRERQSDVACEQSKARPVYPLVAAH